MLWLSDEALEYAVKICRREQNYRVGIVPKTILEGRYVEDSLRAYLEVVDDFWIRRGVGNLMIEFRNGSSIKTIPASSNSRGSKFHLLIADEDINDEILNCILRPLEVLEAIERQNRRNSHIFRSEYLSRWIGSDNFCEREFFNTKDDKVVADISEEDFMNILNISNPQ